MITLVAAMAFAAGDLASDFFPNVAGTKLVYEETGPDGLKTTAIDEVGPTTKVDEIDSIPITTHNAGRRDVCAYYQVTSSSVYLVANLVQPATTGKGPMIQPLPTKMPIIELRDGKGEWDYVASIGRGTSQEPLKVHGVTRSIGARDVLGKRRAVIESKMEAQTGLGIAALYETTVSVYAKGVGLVETTSTSRLGQQKAVHKVKLIRMEVADKS